MKEKAIGHLVKTNPIKANSKPIGEDQYKTQDTRPKIQILSLKSGVWKEGRKVKEVARPWLSGVRSSAGRICLDPHHQDMGHYHRQ